MLISVFMDAQCTFELGWELGGTHRQRLANNFNVFHSAKLNKTASQKNI